MRRRARRLAWPTALAGALASSGCHDAYIARRDGVTFQVGDAVAANKAIHIVDPWPASAASARIPASGTQAVAAVERLEARNGQGAGAGGSSAAGPGPTATPPGASAAAAR